MNYFYPLKLTLGIWIAVVILRLVPLGGYWNTLSFTTSVLLSFWLIVFLLSYIITIKIASKNVGSGINLSSIRIGKARKTILILCIFAATGALLIAYEFVVTRGYGFSTRVAEIRLMEVSGEDNSKSWISGIGRLLTPAISVAWIVGIVFWKTVGFKSLCLLNGATAIVLWQQASFEGGRFALAAMLLSIWFATKMRANSLRKLKETNTWKTLLVVSVVGILFGYVFVDRAADWKGDFATPYMLFTSSFNILIDNETLNRLSGAQSTLWFGLTMLWQYLTQGFNELDLLISYQKLEHAWGGYQFLQITQGISKLADLKITYDLESNLPSVGTYFTFYGANYIDWGHGGAAFSAVALATLCGLCAMSIVHKKVNIFFLMAPSMFVLALFSPIVSLVINLWPTVVWAYVASRLLCSNPKTIQ